MFNWFFSKKKRKAAARAAHEAELKVLLAAKMDRWSQKSHDPEKSAFAAATEYTIVNGQRVLVERVNLGHTENNIGNTVPDLALAENTGDKEGGPVFDNQAIKNKPKSHSNDVWNQANPNETGKWKRNNDRN